MVHFGVPFLFANYFSIACLFVHSNNPELCPRKKETLYEDFV